MGLASILDRGEKVIDDGRYNGEEAIWAKGCNPISGREEGVIWARHETVNSHLKTIFFK